MTTDTERGKIISDVWSGGRQIAIWWLETLMIGASIVSGAGKRLVHWMGRLPIARLLNRSLLGRIIVSNMVGLIILLVGYFYLSQYKDALIAAKRDSLMAQAEIISSAIAANAAVESEGIVLDPDRLPEVEGAMIPFRDDAFAALELSISPEKVTPVLRRLIHNKPVRGRIYDREGKLLVDINPRERPIRSNLRVDDSDRPKTKIEHFRFQFIQNSVITCQPTCRDERTPAQVRMRLHVGELELRRWKRLVSAPRCSI